MKRYSELEYTAIMTRLKNLAAAVKHVSSIMRDDGNVPVKFLLEVETLGDSDMLSFISKEQGKPLRELFTTKMGILNAEIIRADFYIMPLDSTALASFIMTTSSVVRTYNAKIISNSKVNELIDKHNLQPNDYAEDDWELILADFIKFVVHSVNENVSYLIKD